MNLVETAIESNEEFILSEDTQIIVTSINGEEKAKKDKAKAKKKKYKGYTETKKKKIKKRR